MKGILVVFDGLRPDHVSPDRMPNLAAFADDGVRFGNSRTIFPSETRVAVASLVTGSWPARHGIVANEFFDYRFSRERPVDTGSREDLLALQQAHGGALLERASLSERLTAAGLKHAVVSTASPGASFLLDHQAERFRQFSWSVHGSGNTPLDLAQEILRRYGPVPTQAIPNQARIDYAASVLLDFVLPRLQPDLAVFWSSEPDNTYHNRGVGSPESRQAQRAADAAFGRIIDWWRGSPERDRIQIVVASDHGQLTGTAKIDVIQAMRESGVMGGPRIGPGIEAGVLPGSMTSIYAQTPQASLAIESWLRDQAWCGFILKRGESPGPGALAMHLVGTEHARAPDLAFTFAGTDDEDSLGIAGCTVFDADLPGGAGMHVGLTRRELSNVLIAGGGAFQQGVRLELPAGAVGRAPHNPAAPPPVGAPVR